MSGLQVLPHNALLVAACLMTLVLLCGAVGYSDVRYRRIPNVLCLAIAVLAVPYWWGQSGWPGLTDLRGHLLVPLLLVVPLLVIYALKLWGGGDVKLLLAVSLWLVAGQYGVMILATALIGAALGILLKLLNMVFWRISADHVPYGVAIVAGVLLAMASELRLTFGAACMTAM